VAVPFQKRGEIIRLVAGLYLMGHHVQVNWSGSC
jgi:hypothetical protein